ncbi:MAG: peptidylprolyl isomerase [Lachnospiraceae bacterium]
MNRSGKKLAVFLLSAVLAAGSLTGCGGNTKIVFTTGLSGNQLFKIGSAVCTVPEAMVYLSTFYNQYAEIYGSDLWSHDFGGVTLESYVKEVVISKMAQIKVICLMAEERGITLSDEETANVREAAKCYYQSLPEDFRKEQEITQKVAETVFKEYKLANKVYHTITESVELEISDDEARTVTVQCIYLKAFEEKDGEILYYDETKRESLLQKAEAIHRQLESGADFESLAKEYSDEENITISLGRGEKNETVEDTVFALNQDELSDIVSSKEGFYIFRCVKTFDAEATEKNKEVLAQKKQKEAFSSAYEEIVAGTPSQFRDHVWKKITLDQEDFSEASFFEVYDEYLK